ncbi:MAG: hypothetical protein WA890_29920 [Micromonospora sp.]
MIEDEILHRSGLHPAPQHLDHIRELLQAQAELQRQSQGGGDTEVMKLCCVQLFNAGALSDVLPVSRARSSSWDAACSIHVQLLCGQGLAETTAYLAAERSEIAANALEHIRHAEAAGDFTGFTHSRRSGRLVRRLLPNLIRFEREQR